MSLLFDYSDAIYSNVLVNLTQRCNLACTYCYAHSPSSCDNRVISRAVVKSVLKSYAEMLEASSRSRLLYVIWHGGEPLMAGLRFFEDIVAIERELSGPHRSILNGVQTNATLVDSEWAAFFSRHRFDVGVSLDGPQHVNDIHRLSRRGESFFPRTIRGVNALKHQGVPFSVIAVVTDENWQHWRETVDFFAELGAEYVDFTPCCSPGDPVGLHPANYRSFLLSVFEYWTENLYKRLRIRYFDDLIAVVSREVVGSTPIGCEWTGRCGELHFVDQDGDVYPCTCLPRTGELRMGNAAREGLQACVDSPNYRRFQEAFNSLSGECLDCDALDVCRAGCAARRLFFPLDLPTTGRDFYCVARRGIIHAVKTYVSSAGVSGVVGREPDE